MKRMYSRWPSLTCVLGLAMVLAIPIQASADEPTADEVLQQLVARAQSNDNRPTTKSYRCTRQSITEEFDSGGRITRRKVKSGETRSGAGGVAAANSWSKGNGVRLDEDLLRRYTFTLAGKEVLNGRTTHILKFVPRQPTIPPRDIPDRLLNRATGTLWVDEKEFELAKADISLGQPVSFGIFGAVDALSFAFERQRVEDGAWLTSSTDTYFKGRKFLKFVQTRKRVDWSDFRQLIAQQ